MVTMTAEVTDLHTLTDDELRRLAYDDPESGAQAVLLKRTTARLRGQKAVPTKPDPLARQAAIDRRERRAAEARRRALDAEARRRQRARLLGRIDKWAPVPKDIGEGVYALEQRRLKVKQAGVAGGTYHRADLLTTMWPEARNYATELDPATGHFNAPLHWAEEWWLAEGVHRLTAAEAAHYGRLYGRCVFCGRALSDDRSIAVGYGATCAKHHDLPWGWDEVTRP